MASGPGDGGKARKAHDQPVRTQEDLDAWSVWPIADEIAPEMTLTPGEMVLVEAQLANDEAIEAAAVAQEAPLAHDEPIEAAAVAKQAQLAHDEAIEAAAVAQETVSPEASPVVPETEVWAMPGDLAGIAAYAGEPSIPTAVDGLAPTSGPETTAPERYVIPSPIPRLRRRHQPPRPSNGRWSPACSAGSRRHTPPPLRSVTVKMPPRAASQAATHGPTLPRGRTARSRSTSGLRTRTP